MKNLLLLLFVSIGFLSFSQQRIKAKDIRVTDEIRIGKDAGNNSAALEVKDTLRGVLLSRLTQPQITSMPSLDTGLVIYNKDSLYFQQYNGDSWVPMDKIDSLGITNFGFVAGNHTDSMDVASFGFVAGNHTLYDLQKVYSNGNLIQVSHPDSAFVLESETVSDYDYLFIGKSNNNDSTILFRPRGDLVLNRGLAIAKDSITNHSLIDLGSVSDTITGIRFQPLNQTQIDALTLTPSDSAWMVYNRTDSAFQYYDGDTWESFGGGANLYTTDGTLSGARTVDLGSNDLTFKSNTGTEFILYRSASGNGFGLSTSYYLDNASSNKTLYNRISSVITDNTDSSEESELTLSSAKNGTLGVGLKVKKDGIIGANNADLDVYRDSQVGGCKINIKLNNSNGNAINYGQIGANVSSNSPGNESGGLYFNTINGGTSSIVAQINKDGNFSIGSSYSASGYSPRVYIVGRGATSATTALEIENSNGDNALTITDDLTSKFGGQLELSSTDAGALLNRVTTAQMNAISTPKDNELVLNTDLEGLYRYDGANWTALSAGYGVIGVITDSDNGVPTFYADLQSAVNSTFSVGLKSTITLYSNVEVTSVITLSNNTNDSESLTLNLNGFEIVNNQADASGLLVIGGNCANLNLKVINGKLTRNNATGGYAIDINSNKKSVTFSNIIAYSDSDRTLNISNSGYILDLGYSFFENSGGTYTIFNTGSTGRIKNFIATGDANITYRQDAGLLAENFMCINTGSGTSLATRSTDILQNFYAYSDSGTSIDFIGTVNCVNFYGYSESGRVIDGTSSSYIIKDFHLENGNSSTDYVLFSNGGGTREHIGGSIINNGTQHGVFASSGTIMKYVDIKQNNSNYCIVTRTGTLDYYLYCNLVNDGGSALNDNQQSFSKWKFCNFKSNLDTTSGHAVVLTSSSFTFEHCSFEVVNAGANCISGGVGDTTTVVNSTYSGATTPINANVIINSSTDEGNGNRSY